MKIAFINQPQDSLVAAAEQRGSVAIVQWELARQLSARHTVVCYAPRLAGQLHAERRHGIEIRRVSGVARTLHKGIETAAGSLWQARRPYFASHLYFREYFMQIARALRKHAPDVIHLPQSFQFAGLLRRAVPSARIVLHLHQDELIHLPLQATLRDLAHVDALVTVSGYISEKLRSRFPTLASRIHTIYNGVDAERFQPPPDRGTRDCARRLLFVGRISPDKGVHLLMQAFATLAAERPDIELTLVGKPGLLPFDVMRLLFEGDSAFDSMRRFYGATPIGRLRSALGQKTSYLRELQSLLPAEVANRAHFAGTVPLTQLTQLYQSADLLVLPSVWQESYGLPIAEAMASGLPVLASRCGGVPELVDDNVTGRLVPRCDVRVLTENLRAMLADPSALRAMSHAARERALAQMTWSRSAALLEQVYLGATASDVVPHPGILHATG
jgi:glycosyltransferase involved in cell wall biosynthesis